ncbi:LacI family transcriptional regulator [Alicyclobacillus hesperidum subsp. aegles]|uniref:LacI family DNA-binding transcriptional regulator n=1 Tax=Alicyclobacillus hesperidum TaxID=89784 RepID=UPI002229DD8B|nr:LacI family DNA-binding transcriptional regulator [Alicyclobacillus hesperidum]GLG00676.1 LacI family transcriptional regulator [Alicyclobacillus hesperidum subsp. aegles]
MPTMADVARKADVSIMTVSRVINNTGYVKAATRQRVLQAMQEVGYEPKSAAGPLVQTSTLVLVVPDITNPFFTFIARGMEDVARKHGFRMLLANTDESLEKEREYMQMCLDYRIAGVLIVPVGDPSVANLRLLEQHHIPFVLIDRDVEGIDTDLVKGDMRPTSTKLVEHLIELGHRRIAAVVGPLHNAASRERLDGYKDALTRHGIPIHDDMIFQASMTRDMDVSFVEALFTAAKPPTAMFVSNMFQYAHIVRALHHFGIRVPDDVSIVSFGNTDDLASVDSILTAAVQPTYNFGSLGAQLLLERIDGVRKMSTRIVLNSEIVFRASTAPPRP